jgi:amino-acid N-acetyltransferase
MIQNIPHPISRIPSPVSSHSPSMLPAHTQPPLLPLPAHPPVLPIGVRGAETADIAGIVHLVKVHAYRGDVLPRSLRDIEHTLNDWFVAVDQTGEVFACVSLLPYSDRYAEVRSLAVDDRVKGQGYGQAVVAQLIAIARERQIPVVFALTRAVQFFLKAGFSITDKEHYPEKVFKDCSICPLLHNCDEIAVELKLTS